MRIALIDWKEFWEQVRPELSRDIPELEDHDDVSIYEEVD